MIGGSFIMMGHVLFIELQAATGVAGNWTMDGGHVLWPIMMLTNRT
jgi:hypothetical protein